MKVAKVINQYTEGKWCDEVVHGECEHCGAEVSRSRCGRDEECYECGYELDWSEE